MFSRTVGIGFALAHRSGKRLGVHIPPSLGGVIELCLGQCIAGLLGVLRFSQLLDGSKGEAFILGKGESKGLGNSLAVALGIGNGLQGSQAGGRAAGSKRVGGWVSGWQSGRLWECQGN